MSCRISTDVVGTQSRQADEAFPKLGSVTFGVAGNEVCGREGGLVKKSDGIARVGSSTHDLSGWFYVGVLNVLVLSGAVWCCPGQGAAQRRVTESGQSRKYRLGPLELDGGTAGDAGGWMHWWLPGVWR